jgi:hypothetical protein
MQVCGVPLASVQIIKVGGRWSATYFRLMQSTAQIRFTFQPANQIPLLALEHQSHAGKSNYDWCSVTKDFPTAQFS